MMNDDAKKCLYVSIVIPVKNRDDVIGRTLQALEEQDYPSECYQVIVVDDGSTDETARILDEFREHTRLDLAVIRSASSGAGAARNYGLERATGDLVLFLDCDTIPETDMISTHVDLHTQLDGPACIMGPVNMSPHLIKSDQFRLFDTKPPVKGKGLQKVDWDQYRAANTSLTASAIHNIGGFDQSLCAAEDTELAYRLYQKGVPVYYSEQPVCVHHHPMDIDGYMHKGSMYGQAVGLWYTREPELRKELVARYGVTAPELPWSRQIKHGLRTLVINKFTVGLLVLLGKSIRRVWLQGSEQLLKSAFRFNTRKAFYHTIQANNRMAVSGS